jgi:hypothetical protein
MSARERLQAAMVEALGTALAPVTVFDAPPVRGAVPHVVVDEPLLGDWSTKDMTGREGRVAVIARDQGERPARLRGLVAAGEDALEAMPADLGEGWRVVTLTLARSRIAREREGGWIAMSEYRVRMLRVN